MTAPMPNLRALRNAMTQRGWVVACFPFTFKSREYFVLPRRYIEQQSPPKGMLLELTFADRDNLARTLSAPANSYRIDITAQEIREYFGIEWAPNLSELLMEFYAYLGTVIPTALPESLTDEERAAVLPLLSGGDSRDPDRLYCFALRRNGNKSNGEPIARSEFNAQKAELLRPSLFERLKDDPFVSFCFSLEASDERSDAEILRSFAAAR